MSARTPEPPPPDADLLVFTLGPAGERARRPLLPGHLADLETAVRGRCLDAALAAGRAAGCRLLVSSPYDLDLPADAVRRPQKGASFGERLSGAVADARGERTLVVVGSDVPGLSGEIVRRALDLLAAAPARIVLGTSPDGGIYLLAGRDLPADALARVQWCSPETFASLVAELGAVGRDVALLPPLADLDRRADLERLVAARHRLGDAWRALLGALAAALADLSRPPAPAALGRPLPVRVAAPRGRAPPRLQSRG